jgi:ADP-heptose:LPS heptosyltransferase
MEQHQVLGNLRLLSAWGIAIPDHPRIEVAADPLRAEAAARLLPRPALLCHLGTSQPKKEWPVTHWAEFHRLAAASGYSAVFSAGVSPREQALLRDLKRLAPDAPLLPPAPDLATFIAAIGRARLFISGDTGPLHFAAGLGVPAIALFGPSAADRWVPFSQQYRTLQGGPCACDAFRSDACCSPSHCMAAISPQAVLEQVLKMQPKAA